MSIDRGHGIATSSVLADSYDLDGIIAKYEQFADTYLGHKAVEPTTDDDGDALIVGALYFNTVDGELRVYDGTTWKAVYAGALKVNNFTGDGTTVAFTMSSSPNNENSTQVYIDGVYQQKDTYTTVGAVLTFSEAPPTGAGIEVMIISSFEVSVAVADNVTYSQGGTGSVSRTVENKLQESVSVKDFGAVGDGVTDDTAAIQAALDSGAKYIVFPESGTNSYLLTNQLSVPTRVTVSAYGATLNWTDFGSTLASTAAEHAATGNAIRLLSNSVWKGGRITLNGVVTPSGRSIPVANFSGAFWNVFAIGHFNTATTATPETITERITIKDVDVDLVGGGRNGFALVAGHSRDITFSNCSDDTSSNSSDTLLGIEATWGAGGSNVTYHPYNVLVKDFNAVGANLGDYEAVRFSGAYDSGTRGFRGKNVKKGVTFYVGDPGTNTTYGNTTQTESRNGTGLFCYDTVIDKFNQGIRILGDGNGSTHTDRKTNLVDVSISSYYLNGNGNTVNTSPWASNTGIYANSARGFRIGMGMISECYQQGIAISSSTGGAFTTPDEIEIDGAHIHTIGVDGINIDELTRSVIKTCRIHDTNTTGTTPNANINLTDATDVDVIENTLGKSGDTSRFGILVGGTSSGNRAIRNNVQSGAAGAYSYTAGELVVYGDNKAAITNPADGYTKVTNVMNMGVSSEVTIATGAITLTGTHHSIDTEADAASDDLTDVTFPDAQSGDRVSLRAHSSSRTVNVTHATGTAGTQTRTKSGATEALSTGPTDFQYDGNAWWKL